VGFHAPVLPCKSLNGEPQEILLPLYINNKRVLVEGTIVTAIANVKREEDNWQGELPWNYKVGW
jgi:hypothetical protein